jgi:hypothetical protein
VIGDMMAELGLIEFFCCLKKVCEGGITSAERLSANFLQIEQNQRISGHGWNMETWKCNENKL